MIAGPNGAGKSTLYELVLKPVIAAPFINADLIQRDELADVSMPAAYKAAAIAQARRLACLREGRSFVSESTFSHPSKLDLIGQAKGAGFRVLIHHVNLRSAELSVMRVATRVAHGGHDVPPDKIRARYERNQSLIRDAVLQADRAYVYDNSALAQLPERVLDLHRGQVVRVAPDLPAWVATLYGLQLQAQRPAP